MEVHHTEEQMSNMITAADEDGDGRVGKGEFVRFMKRESNPNPKSKVIEAFLTLAENEIPGKTYPSEPGKIHIDKLKYVMGAFVEGFSEGEIDHMCRVRIVRSIR